MTMDRTGQFFFGRCASPNAIRLRSVLRLSRRDTLMGVAAGLALTGSAWADTPATKGSGSLSPSVDQFMALSAKLTERSSLDPLIGAALLDQLVQTDANRPPQMTALHELMVREQPKTAEDFARAAEKADPAFKDLIHDILAGWYRGVANGRVVVYRSALMFDITKDAVYPKTYAAGGPFYWTTQPPDVPRPTGHPALSPSKLVIEPT
ncbi:sorbitol dehydrogenase family protein [Acetobacter sp.]|uniref:sorbitol dehydrogenase family protein n=1 Tax=Acetobacter sp. TaxID=440 RepID=UPI0039E94288